MINSIKSEKFFNSICDFIPLGVLIVDAQGRILGFNKKSFEMFGDKLKKVNFENLFLSKDRQKLKKIYSANATEKTDNQKPLVLCYPVDNKKQFFEINYSKKKDQSLVISIRNVTRRINIEEHHEKAEKALQKSEEKFHSIFTSTMNSVFILDNNCAILDINPSAEHLLKTQKKKLSGMPIYKLLDTNSSEEFMNLWNDFLVRKKQKGEFKMVLKNGLSYEIEYSAVKNFFSGYNLLVLHDITELKLEQKRQDYYLGIVGHELRTPLATIKAFAQISQKYVEKNQKDKINISLSKIDRHVNELAKLVNELLDVTKIKAGKLKLYEEVFDFDVLAEKIIQEISANYPKFKILKKGKTNKLILADKRRISEILNTLISNAIKYSSNSTKIAIELSSSKNDVVFKVRDFGVGIPKEKQKEIFEVFSKAGDLTKRVSSGLGLALYISSEIAKYHGGRIWADSFSGKGSTFNLMLPAKKNSNSQKK